MFTISTFFLFCAVIAGTIFVCQFVLLLIGFGGHGLDVGDGGHDLDFGGHGGDLADGHVDGGSMHDGDHGHHEPIDHGSTWLFGVISLRTMVAAVLFFGLAGLAAESANVGPLVSTLIGVAAGVAAMYGVHYVMRMMYRLGADGGLRIQHAVGKTATVYLPIPGDHAGTGKIQIRMQGRLAELPAMTKAVNKLPSGSQVKVVGLIGGSTVEVVPVHKPAAV